MISIVLATKNGRDVLPLTLDAMSALEPPPGGYEVIVVDNGSTDGSPELIQGYRDRLPLTLLSEPRPGKSLAVAKGAASARYGFILFTDDDVIPDPGWLPAYARAAEAQPSVGIFAGQVRHHWQSPPPRWLVKLAEEGRAYAGTPLDREAGPIGFQFIKGPNFLVRSQVLDGVSLNNEFGPDGTRNYVAGSETAFLMQAEAAGYRAHFVPEAVVEHIVRPWQIGVRPVVTRYFRIGRGMQKTGVAPINSHIPLLFGYPRYMYSKSLQDIAVAARTLAKGDSAGCVSRLMNLSTDWGRAYQWRKDRE